MPEISEQDFRALKDQVQNLANQLAAAKRRIAELEDFATDHIGLDWGATNVDINSPHPNMSVNTIESGGGTIRQDANGMQVQAPSSDDVGVIHFVPALISDPSTSTDYQTFIYGRNRTGSGEKTVGMTVSKTGEPSITMEIEAQENYGFGVIRASGTTGGKSKVLVDSNQFGDDYTSAHFLSSNSTFVDGVNPAMASLYIEGSTNSWFGILNVPLYLFGMTADPSTTLNDGMLWYRSDTDKFRARVNGATKNLALEDTLIHGDGSELTIATGAITITTGYHRVDTQADAASDDLDTISGGTTGQILVLRAENDARSVVAKDGTGNLKLAGDCTLDNTEDTLTLIYNGTNWLELSRSDNGA